MLTATVSHHFSAGHRIVGLTGAGAKCANIHGHTFGVQWTVELPDLTAGSVEFGTIKQLFREWIDGNIDHGFIVHDQDQEMIGLLKRANSKHLVLATRPTTEAIAVRIAEQCQRICPDIRLLEVRVTEGPHNAATWTYDWHGVVDADEIDRGTVDPDSLAGFNPYEAHMRGNEKFDQELGQ